MVELLKNRSRSGLVRSMALRMKAWAEAVLEASTPPEAPSAQKVKRPSRPPVSPSMQTAGAVQGSGPRASMMEVPEHWLQDVQTMQAGAATVWRERARSVRESAGMKARRPAAPEGGVPLRAVTPLLRRGLRAAASPAPVGTSAVPWWDEASRAEPGTQETAPAPAAEPPVRAERTGELVYPWPEPSAEGVPEPRDTVALLHQWARLRGLELEPWGE
ncbi:hypothetical protein POL68_32550 [Stigmatella sp. ncwal1]|uniref:Uncharacterized protein n=1 Tax=Stigmatella ashevillensis TaxID=2995309 RepID=A0ABT5DKE0_9BACT|nr:hypothetical protein [Stigmatella ashevillena]MDC0713238.1 hypothetical protein [Stigmatella ashevillena]